MILKRSLIFDFLLVWASQKHCPMSEKNYHKKERHFYLITLCFSKLSQNMCPINTHILLYWYARCNCKLWFNCIFLEFSYIIDEHLGLKYFIFTKLSQIVSLINVHIFVCQHIKCDCWLWKVLWCNAFFVIFIYYKTCLKRFIASSNFYKLCIKADV